MLLLSRPTVEFVLTRVSQEDIMTRYTGVAVKLKVRFSSPLRFDKHPSCTFRWYNNKLWLLDGTTKESLDCFNVVQRVYHCDFPTALEHIARDFHLLDSARAPVPELVRQYHQPVSPPEPKQIRVRVREWSEQDTTWWGQQGISTRTLDAGYVYPLSHVWLDDGHHDRCVYAFRETDPAYGYWSGVNQTLGVGEWKVYFPLRDRHDSRPRFMANGPWIQGLHLLPPTGEILVLTKSYKDSLLLREHHVPSVPPPAENTPFPPDLVRSLQERFTQVVSLYDFDRTGVTGAQRLRRLYNIPALFLTTGRFGSPNYHAKDLTDYVRLHGPDQFLHLLSTAQQYLTTQNSCKICTSVPV